MSDVLKPHPADRTSPFPLRPGRRCLAALGMVAAMAALLLVMGRDPTCPCGVVRLWQSGLDPLENSQQFADWYSLLHVVFGMALAAFVAWMRPRWSLGALLLCVILGHSIWEVAENTPVIIGLFSGSVNAPHYEGDSILNSLGDTVFALAGALLARRAPLWTSVLVVLAVEIAVTFAIDDGFVIGTLRLVGVNV
ncbi:hypothetical protein ASG43_04320 [Aureimonas sp. Leaf454]|nr:hypothetical protein ASG43_04320 [Aureimonas sp. Leaf454]